MHESTIHTGAHLAKGRHDLEHIRSVTQCEQHLRTTAVKRDITHFYIALNKPISDVTEQDMREYAQLLTIRGLKPTTVTRVTNCIRRYWQFAHTQEVRV